MRGFRNFTNNLLYHVDVSRPDRLSSAEIAAIVQAAGLQGLSPLSRTIPLSIGAKLQDHLAVRKNRYVILPIDFEEAWKVSCLVMF